MVKGDLIEIFVIYLLLCMGVCIFQTSIEFYNGHLFRLDPRPKNMTIIQ